VSVGQDPRYAGFGEPGAWTWVKTLAASFLRLGPRQKKQERI